MPPWPARALSTCASTSIPGARCGCRSCLPALTWRPPGTESASVRHKFAGANLADRRSARRVPARDGRHKSAPGGFCPIDLVTETHEGFRALEAQRDDSRDAAGLARERDAHGSVADPEREIGIPAVLQVAVQVGERAVE